MGCIPVLMQKVAQAQWRWHWGEWVANASVLLESAPGDSMSALLEKLAAIPPREVHAMQATIAAHAHLLQYHAVDSALLQPAVPPRDAFDVVLENAWRVSQDEQRRARGRTSKAATR